MQQIWSSDVAAVLHLPLLEEYWNRDYDGRIMRYHETVILNTGTGNPITGNLPAQLRQLISSQITVKRGQKTVL